MSDSDIDVSNVLKFLPHRYPFLLVDRVLEFEQRKSLLALKNVTHNEPFFMGHFPENPVMPGVLVVESLAQTAGILVMLTGEFTIGKDWFYFAGIDNARFKRIVKPGDQLRLAVNVEKERSRLWKFSAVATVDDDIACSAEIMVAK